MHKPWTQGRASCMWYALLLRFLGKTRTFAWGVRYMTFVERVGSCIGYSNLSLCSPLTCFWARTLIPVLCACAAEPLVTSPVSSRVPFPRSRQFSRGTSKSFRRRQLLVAFVSFCASELRTDDARFRGAPAHGKWRTMRVAPYVDSSCPILCPSSRDEVSAKDVCSSNE